MWAGNSDPSANEARVEQIQGEDRIFVVLISCLGLTGSSCLAIPGYTWRCMMPGYTCLYLEVYAAWLYLPIPGGVCCLAIPGPCAEHHPALFVVIFSIIGEGIT